jgi:hypothetical protein
VKGRRGCINANVFMESCCGTWAVVIYLYCFLNHIYKFYVFWKQLWTLSMIYHTSMQNCNAKIFLHWAT